MSVGDIAAWNAWRQRSSTEEIDLSNTNLLGAHLPGIDLSGANLQYANLQGADLRDANLQSANLQEADLRGADLTRASLRSATLKSARLRGAIRAQTDVRDVLWGSLGYLRQLPRGWVLLAAFAVFALPAYGFVASLVIVLQSILTTGPWSNDNLLSLEEVLLFPFVFLLFWDLVRVLISLPFDAFVVGMSFLRRIRQRKVWLGFAIIGGLLEAVFLFFMIGADLGNPVPFLDAFSEVAQALTTHADAVLIMKAKLAILYIALVIVNLVGISLALQQYHGMNIGRI
jgi:hypothetical protein